MYILKAAWNLTGFWLCKPTEQTYTKLPSPGHWREGGLYTCEPLTW